MGKWIVKPYQHLRKICSRSMGMRRRRERLKQP
jgi:hypothetical protein